MKVYKAIKLWNERLPPFSLSLHQIYPPVTCYGPMHIIVLLKRPLPQAIRIARNRSSRDSNFIQHVARRRQRGEKKEECLGIISRWNALVATLPRGGQKEASEKTTPKRASWPLLMSPPSSSNYSECVWLRARASSIQFVRNRTLI